MNSLDLFKQFCPYLIPPNLKDKLGDGSDGEVYSLKDNEKVIKFSANYLPTSGKDAIQFLIKSPTDTYARVFSYESYGPYSKDDETFVLSVTILEKLRRITDDEERVFHSILSHEDRNIVKNFSLAKLKKMLDGLRRGLDFDAERVTLFCSNLRKTPVRHPDIHPRNIMKDEFGHFKLIDFDHLILEINNDTEN